MGLFFSSGGVDLHYEEERQQQHSRQTSSVHQAMTVLLLTKPMPPEKRCTDSSGPVSSDYRLSRIDVLTSSLTMPLAIFTRVFLLPPGLIVSVSLTTSAGLNFLHDSCGQQGNEHMVCEIPAADIGGTPGTFCIR